MASFNQIVVVGNLGKDPESRAMPSGDSVSNFSVATTESWKAKDGSKQEHVEWHRISAFGKLAEICNEYLKKGSLVLIVGKVRTRSWEKDGEKKYSTEIIADRMQMLGGKPSGDSQRQESKPAPQKKTGGSFDDMDSDIPF